MKIKNIKARQILDSRGNPTIEVDVATQVWRGRAKVPSGASTGKHEALELRDKAAKYDGKGVTKAVRNVNTKIFEKLVGMDVTNQEKIDKTMIALDGTENKSNLGANAILGVSIACSRAAAHCKHMYYEEYLGELAHNHKFLLPVPFMNIINGGEHADNKLAFQEFMIVPAARTFSKSLRLACETYHELKRVINKKIGPGSTGLGDEGGFAPNVSTVREAFDLLMEAIENTGNQKYIKFAIDAAASYFYREGKYHLDGHKLDEEQLVGFYEDLVHDYPLVSIEDPFHEEDFQSFSKLVKSIGKNVNIVGDDLTVTNPDRIRKALGYNACNCLLLKVNQIGTLTEAFEAARIARKNSWGVMVSHRSGETCDPFIADLAVGLGKGMIKAGAPARGERTAKYNQLLRLEERHERYAGAL